MSQSLCLRHFVLMFCGTASLTLFLACSYFSFAKIKAIVVIKLFSCLKKECIRFPCKYEEFEKVGYVIFCTVFN